MAALDLSNLQIDLSGLDIETEPQGSGSGLWGALSTSITRQLPGAVAGGVGAAAETLGFNGTAQQLFGWQEQQEQAAQREYQRPSGVAPSIREGWNNAPDTLTGLGQAGQAALYGAAESIGSAVPGLISALPVGRIVRAIMAVPNGAQILASIREERQRQGLSPELTAADYANAIAQVGVDLIPGGRSIMRMLLSEAGKETAQEAATIGGTALQGGNAPNREETLNRLVDAGVVGGLLGAGTQATVGRVFSGEGGASEPVPTRATTAEDAELAERIRNQTQADGSPVDLSMRERGVVGGAVTAVQSVRSEILEEAKLAHNALQKLARLEGDAEALRDLQVFKRKAFDRNDTNASEEDFRRIEARFGDTEEGQKLISLARQRARLQPFLQPQGTYGGISARTRFLDPTTKNATGFQKAIGIISPWGLTGIAVNRAAEIVDKLTGRYSPVERFVKSAENVEAPVYMGESVYDRIDALKEEKTRTVASEEAWRAAAAMESERLGREVSPEELRKRVEAQSILASLRRAEEAAANAEQGAKNRAARSARNQTAQGGSLNVREDTQAGEKKSPKDAEYERFIALAEGIKGEIRAAREEGRRFNFAPFQGDKGFSGALKRAYGQLATEARANLADNLDPSFGPDIQNDILDTLRQMESKESYLPDRRGLLESLQYKYGEYDNPWIQDALRAARDYVEAAPDPPKAKEAKPTKEPKATSQPNITVNITIPGFENLAALAKANSYVTQGQQPIAAPTPKPTTTPPDPVEAGKEVKTPPANPTPAQAEAEQAVKEKEAKKRRVGRPKKTTGDEVLEARRNYARSFALAKDAQELDTAIQSFRDQGTDKGLIQALILEEGTDHVTTYGLVSKFAKEKGIKQSEAVEPVVNALNELRKDGVISAFRGQKFLIKGKQQRDKDNAFLQDTVIAFKEKTASGQSTDFYRLLEISKARGFSQRTPDVRNPHQPFSLENGFKSSVSDAIDGFSTSKKAQAAPLIEALNNLRSMGTGINRSLIDDVLTPLVNSTEENLAFQKAMKPDGNADAVRALGLLMHQLADVDGTVIYQEAHADSRGRIYMRNGMAGTQSGDLMKALTRAPYSAPPTARGLEHLFHSWGNIVGTDGKAAIKDRRSQYVAAIPSLLKLAKNPFPKDGKYDPDVERILDVEGPFQAIAVARDTASLVDFAKKRHKDFKPEMLDPNSKEFNEAVFNDIAENWKTDAIAQFDGNNNSFQITGAFTADPAILMGTSMMPRPGDDPDPENRRTADVYVDPAKAAIRAGFMDALGKTLEDAKGVNWLRNVVKNSISTYVYDSSPQGAAQTVFNGFVSKGYADWIPQSYFDEQRKNVKKVGGATEFEYGERTKGLDGRVLRGEDGKKTTKPIRYRVRKDNGKYELLVERADGNGFRHVAWYDTQKEAMDHPVLNGLAGKLTGEIRRQVDAMYPGLAQSIKFFRDVVKWAKDQGGVPIRYATPDGIEFTYELDEVPSDGKWDSIVVKQGNFQYRLPILDGKSISGRGLGANVTHAHDAWVLRAALKESGVKYMNPIHDSFGFHPSEAENGIMSVLGAMAGLASNSDYNVYLDIVTRNNIPHILDTQVEETRARLIQEALRQVNPRTGKTNALGQAVDEAERQMKKIVVVPTKKHNIKIDPNQIRTAVS